MDEKGYVSCILSKKLSLTNDDHYIETDWNEIPKLSVLTGINGIGKSTILKMINFYFNRVQLNYKTKDEKLKYNCNNGIIDPDIAVSLIHFDNNSIDLRSRDFTSKSYNNMLQFHPKNKELNFSNEIKKLELELIEKTSITDYLDDQEMIVCLKKFNVNFVELKEHQNDFELKWDDCFPSIVRASKIKFITSILNYKGIISKQDDFLPKTTSIRKILIDNILDLEGINKLLEDSKFEHKIDIHVKSKVFYWKKTSQVSELDLDQQLILFKTLKKHQKRNHKCQDKRNQVLLEDFSDETVDKFIKLLLFEKLITLSELNKELKDNEFTNEVKLEIY